MISYAIATAMPSVMLLPMLVVGATDACHRQTEYNYDHVGRMTSMTSPPTEAQPNGQTTWYGYDQHGNRIARVLPDASRYDYYFDAGNRLTQEARPDGSVVDYAYDEVNRLTSLIASKSGSNGSGPLDVLRTTQYDVLSRPRLISDRVGTVSITVTHDHSTLGATSETTHSSLASLGLGGSALTGKQFAMHYSPVGELSRITYPSGLGVVGHYEPDIGRLSSVQVDQGSGAPVTIASAIASTAYGTGYKQVSWSGTTDVIQTDRDALSFVTDRKVLDGPAELAGASYAYDAANNLTTRTQYDGRVESFGYDDFHRLESWSFDVNGVSYPTLGSKHTTSWTRDLNDNITQIQQSWDDVNTPDQTISPALSGTGINQYAQFGDLEGQSCAVDGEVVYDDNGSQECYDANGQQFQWRYDALNRPFDANIDGAIHRFYHDGLGRMIAHDAGGELTRYLHLGSRIRVQDSKPSSAGSFGNQIEFVYGLGMARVHGSAIEHLLTDPFGNVTDILRADGQNGLAVIESYDYDPFGTPRLRSPGAPNDGELLTESDTTNSLLFLAKPYIWELDLYRLGARFYNPGSGSFTQTDPLQDAPFSPGGAFNLYQYPSNPFMYSDPSGLVASQAQSEGSNEPNSPRPDVYIKYDEYGRPVDLGVRGAYPMLRGSVGGHSLELEVPYPYLAGYLSNEEKEIYADYHNRLLVGDDVWRPEEPHFLDAVNYYYQHEPEYLLFQMGVLRVEDIKAPPKEIPGATNAIELQRHRDEMMSEFWSSVDRAYKHGRNELFIAAGTGGGVTVIRAANQKVRHFLEKHAVDLGIIAEGNKNRNVVIGRLTLDDGTRINVTAINGKKSPGNTVGPEGERAFSTRWAMNAQGRFKPRYWDSEVKLLEYFNRRLGPNASGTLRIISMHEPCDSCLSVIRQFQEKWDIFVTVHYGDP